MFLVGEFSHGATTLERARGAGSQSSGLRVLASLAGNCENELKKMLEKAS